jgi:hypothetical protein
VIDPADFVADVLFKLGRKIAQFSRRKTRTEQCAETYGWDRNHIVLINGSCCVCEQLDVDAMEMCPGPHAKKKK